MPKKNNLSKWNELIKEFGYYPVLRWRYSKVNISMDELELLLIEKEADLKYHIKKTLEKKSECKKS